MNSLIGVTQNLWLNHGSLLAQVEYSTSTQGNPPGPLFWICGLVSLVWMIFVFAGIWKVFTKAGQPGWAILVPFYNIYVLCKIVGRPGWWLILVLMPVVGFIFTIILTFDLAKSFGKGIGFGFGLLFLGAIFALILGFGSAQYQGPAAGSMGGARPPQTA